MEQQTISSLISNLDEQTVSVSHEGFPRLMNFSDADFPEFIKDTLEREGYSKPTPVQSQVWPIALKGRDVVGIAQTGSGKTLAYSLPAILQIYSKENAIRDDGPTVLILAPTRELAQQINKVVSNFLKGSSVTSACVFGGASKGLQLYNLEKGCNILIATPGRLIDFLESRCFTLKGCDFLVLDEADRMLDMGFEPQIRTIFKQVPHDRQTLMFSATWPEEVRSLAEEFLHDYVQVNVGALQLSANHNIKQIVEIIDEAEKDQKLLTLLKDIMEKSENKTIIFASTKVRVSELTYYLRDNGFSVISMHGNKSQVERDHALKQFRDGTCQVLVATDVAARGLDVDDIKYVINVDYPNSSEDYVHRIGRTARVNNSGTAYTFFTFQDMKQAKELVDILTEAQQEVEPALLNLVEMSKTFGKSRSLASCSLGYGRYEDESDHNSKKRGRGRGKMRQHESSYSRDYHDNSRRHEDSSSRYRDNSRNYKDNSKSYEDNSRSHEDDFNSYDGNSGNSKDNSRHYDNNSRRYENNTRHDGNNSGYRGNRRGFETRNRYQPYRKSSGHHYNRY